MPPKRNIPAPAQSQPAQKQQEQGENMTQEQQESFKINDEALSKNVALVKRIRTYGALNAGILAGLFGLGGGAGFLLYIVFFLLVSGVLLYKGNFKLNQFFTSPNDILLGGMGADLTLFLMIWVISHNLVNIL